MTVSRNLLWAFLLPALLVTSLTLLLGFWSINSLQHQFVSSSQLQTQDLHTITEAAQFSREMAQVHERVAAALSSAIAGSLSELQLYYLHTDITDDLGQLHTRVQQLAASNLLQEVNHGSAAALLKEYELYRRFVIMATDIAAIDPSTAAFYINEAQMHFIHFSSYAHRITELLSTRAELRRVQSTQAVTGHFTKILLLGAVGLLLMFLLAYLSARFTSRRLQVIADALLLLAAKRGQQELPSLSDVEKLHKQSDGEFGLIASALLDFRHAENSRREAEQKVEHLAYYDSLTELANRRLLTEHLRHSLQMNSRTHQLGALIYFDLDHFKSVNDTSGHTMGDRLLVEVARRLNQFSEANPVIGRLGGDEFVLLLDSLGKDAAHVAHWVEGFAEQVRLSLAVPYCLDQENFQITPSIGVVIFDGIEHTTEDLFRFADAAMYRAKQAGRNTICFYDPEVQSALEERTQLERDLRMAVERDELFLAYQLQVDTAVQPLGAEALLRWNNPVKGLISPAAFIPLAEESGLIIPIGYWVVRTACLQLLEWQRHAATKHLILAVNVSARQFKEIDFVERVQAILAE
ncbi:MAG: diguanylate cyclase, partial [Marinospirillum sp.]|uniref:putative bifunctional diguanylate cyclase/phosphodiesterase n=1 Tax=Marinospirillum sp. TaxID=2183934 RepID=UPI0019E22355